METATMGYIGGYCGIVLGLYSGHFFEQPSARNTETRQPDSAKKRHSASCFLSLSKKNLEPRALSP